MAAGLTNLLARFCAADTEQYASRLSLADWERRRELCNRELSGSNINIQLDTKFLQNELTH